MEEDRKGREGDEDRKKEAGEQPRHPLKVFGGFLDQEAEGTINLYRGRSRCFKGSRNYSL